jgi:hypothetical protein
MSQVEGSWENITYEVDYEEAKDLVDLYSIIFDLNSVIEATEKILNLMGQEKLTDDDQLTIEHLWASALVKYFRCFTTGVRRQFLSPLSNVFSYITEGDPIYLHNYFNSIRNKHIAHSVNDQEVLKVGITINIDVSNNPQILGFSPLASRRIYENMTTIQDFLILAKVALKYAQGLRAQVEAQALVLAQAEGVESIMKRPKLQLKIDPNPQRASKARER